MAGTVTPAPLQVLASNRLFGGLPSADLEALAARTHERPMRRGETLFRRGDPGSGMLAILAGEVRITIASASGREQVLRILKPGEIFGEIALLDGQPRTADATALTNGRLLVLERRDLLARLEVDGGLALRIIAMLCDRLRSTSRQLEVLLFHDISVRLADTLLSLAGAREPPRVDITQSALGDIVGATRETVNKKLREWEIAGHVELIPGRVILRQPAALAALLPDGAVAR